MKTVMIADDEVLVRLGLQTLIPWEEHGYRLVGVFKNGQEAWEAVCANPPDVLLTDIRMPVMDGLELAERVAKEYKTTNVIILSSYEEKEYLRKSIKVGVKDFIPKYELNPADFLQILDQLPYAEAMRMNVEQMTEAGLEAEKKALLKLTARCREDAPEDVSPERFPALYGKGKPLVAPYYTWLVLQPLEVPTGITEPRMRAIEFQVGEMMQRSEEFAYIGSDGSSLHVLLFSKESNALELAGKLYFDMQNEARRNLNIDLAIGISMATSRFMLLGKLREQAETACHHCFYQGPGLQVFVPGMVFSQLADIEWEHKKVVVNKYLADKEYEKLHEWLESELDKAKEAGLRPTDVVRLCQLVCRQLADHVQVNEPHLPYVLDENWKLLDILDHPGSAILSMSALKSGTLSFIRERISAIRQRNRTSTWISNILQTIHNSFSQPLRLEDLAERYNFSASYLSQRFQSEVGMPFTDYLSKIRIEKAKELLRNSRLSTEEISLRVGYINPNYFVKVFKKVTGQTITAFKIKENRGERNVSSK